MRRRLPVLALAGEREAEPDPCSEDGGVVGLLVRLAEERSERIHDLGVAALEPEGELRVAEAKIATDGAGDGIARLEVLDGHAQLPREDPQRFDGRRTVARLDPAQVGVGSTRLGKLALSKPALDAEPANASAD